MVSECLEREAKRRLENAAEAMTRNVLGAGFFVNELFDFAEYSGIPREFWLDSEQALGRGDRVAPV